jgi:Immunoglobulin I-set domain
LLQVRQLFVTRVIDSWAKHNFMIKRFLVVCLTGLSLLIQARAQLAITEVMTGEADKNHPDWWELHNYGTNSIDLSSYCWNDDSHGGFSGADAAPFAGITIHSNETIIFTEPGDDVATTNDFYTWWGVSNYTVVMLGGGDPGLGKGGDDVRLWSTNLAAMGSNTNGLDLDGCAGYLVQQLVTGPTTDQSLLYDSANGVYDILSISNVDGATNSTTGDVGSPGIAPAPVAPTITQTPADASVTIGGTVTFTNAGLGLPPLVFRWYSNDVQITSQTPGVSIQYTNDVSIISLSGAQTANPGTYTYTAVADNGLQSFTNSATLTVNATPSAPTILSAPLDNFDAYVGQTVALTVTADGYPTPTYQWYSNDVEMAGETGNVLTLNLPGDSSGTNYSAIYSVIVTNTVGGTNVSVALNVTPVPNLVITEVESSEGTNTDNGDPSQHGDWFELTSFADFPVNLYGYRIDDSHDDLSVSATVTNRATIHPGESVVFVQDMTPDEFRTWWGTNLSPSVQIIDYNGSGQGLSASGDAVYIWNAAAPDVSHYVTAVTFGACTNGATFGYNLFALTLTPDYYQSGFDAYTLTTNGINGAFTAAIGGDVGSPGAIVNMPRFTGGIQTDGGFQLSWVSQPDWSYLIQYKTNLMDPAWIDLGNVLAGDSNMMTFMDATTNAQRFYRVSLSLTNAP